jgi:hypothetical protein
MNTESEEYGKSTLNQPKKKCICALPKAGCAILFSEAPCEECNHEYHHNWTCSKFNHSPRPFLDKITCPLYVPTPPAQEEKRHVSKCCLSGFIAHESGYYNCNACKENCDVFVPPQQKEPETNYRKRGEPIDFDKLKGIAADMKEPETWEETKYKGIDEPYYKGPGEHSVRDLEKNLRPVQRVLLPTPNMVSDRPHRSRGKRQRD